MGKPGINEIVSKLRTMRMRRVGMGLSAFALASGGVSAASVAPFHPALTTNTDAHMCDAFERAWTGVYNTSHDIDERWVDIAEAFPEARILAFGERRADGEWETLYEHSIAQRLDFDGDGDDEVLFLQSNDIGWRHLGADLYLFDSVAAYDEANGSDAHKYMHRLIVDGRTPIDPPPQHLFRYQAGFVAHVIVEAGQVYTMSFPTAPKDDAPGHVDLYRLSTTARPLLVCSMDLSPPLLTLSAFSDHSTVFQALSTMYGGQDCDMGSMGWTAPPANSHLPTMFYRPQAMPSLADLRRDDEAREVRLLSWALSDPSSWRTYLQLKAGRSAFIDDMSGYYRARLGRTRKAAHDLAERAYRFLLDSIVYARAEDPYRLTGVTGDPRNPLGINVDSSPHEIARAAVARWFAVEHRGMSSFQAGRIRREVALAALRGHTAPDVARRALREALASYDAELADVQARMPRAQSREAAQLQQAIARRERERRLYLQSALLAALGRADMTAVALDAGAEIDGPTNWFGKTALMYAAQNNDASSVRFLLRRGASPTKVTDSAGDPWCRALDRDARTPLMYAAENASIGLIEQLLDAGADPSAVDSKGNTVHWYLDRNASLNGDQRRRLRPRLD